MGRQRQGGNSHQKSWGDFRPALSANAGQCCPARPSAVLVQNQYTLAPLSGDAVCQRPVSVCGGAISELGREGGGEQEGGAAGRANVARHNSKYTKAGKHCHGEDNDGGEYR